MCRLRVRHVNDPLPITFMAVQLLGIEFINFYHNCEFQLLGLCKIIVILLTSHETCVHPPSYIKRDSEVM